jgi:hypothetical protein
VAEEIIDIYIVLCSKLPLSTSYAFFNKVHTMNTRRVGMSVCLSVLKFRLRTIGQILIKCGIRGSAL